MCIPLGETESGKAVYMVMPHDFTGQTISALFWKLTGGEDFRVEDLVDYINGGLPYSSLNPYLQFIIDLVQYGSGKNPYDAFRGREMIPETKWKAGGTERFRAFAEQEWNRIGLSYLYRFPYDDLDKVQNDFEKALDAPSIGPALKRFVRISDRGISDKSRKLIEENEQQKARDRIKMDKEMEKGINAAKSPGQEEARKLYDKLKENGLQVDEWHDFWRKYQTKMNYRANDAVHRDVQAARSNEQKAIILSRHLGMPVKRTQVRNAMKLIELRQRKERVGLSRPEEAELRDREEEFGQ
jgi:hypothetical protein